MRSGFLFCELPSWCLSKFSELLTYDWDISVPGYFLLIACFIVHSWSKAVLYILSYDEFLGSKYDFVKLAMPVLLSTSSNEECLSFWRKVRPSLVSHTYVLWKQWSLSSSSDKEYTSSADEWASSMFPWGNGSLMRRWLTTLLHVANLERLVRPVGFLLHRGKGQGLFSMPSISFFFEHLDDPDGKYSGRKFEHDCSGLLVCRSGSDWLLHPCSIFAELDDLVSKSAKSRKTHN